MHPRFATMNEVLIHLDSRPYTTRTGGAYYPDGKVFEVCTHGETAAVWDHSIPLPNNRGRVWAEEWIQALDGKPGFPSSGAFSLAQCVGLSNFTLSAAPTELTATGYRQSVSATQRVAVVQSQKVPVDANYIAIYDHVSAVIHKQD